MTISPDEEARFLSEVDVIEPLSREEIDELTPRLSDRRLTKGEFLYGPGERGDGLFVLKEGRVLVYKTDARGGEFTLEVLGEGTVFGEMSLGPGRLRATYAQAVEPSLVATLHPRAARDHDRRGACHRQQGLRRASRSRGRRTERSAAPHRRFGGP